VCALIAKGSHARLDLTPHSSENAAQKESALYIFSVVPSLFGSELERYINEIKAMLTASLHDAAHRSVCCVFMLA
jgi:hypothetical protein